MNTVRREEIKKYIEHKDVVSLKELSTAFSNVSLMTIHRDLDFLEEQGYIIRIRGGARYIGHRSVEPAFETREIVNKDAKELIASKAVQFVSEENSVFFDAGTTVMALAKLTPDININILTSGPNIGLELAKKRNPTITLCGGTLNRSNLTLSGASTIDMISNINIDTAFIAASGYSPEGGFTCGFESEGQLKTAICKKARRVILLMDHSKFNRMLPFTFATMKDIDVLIVDSPLPQEILTAAQQSEVQVV